MSTAPVEVHTIDEAITVAPRLLGYQPHEDLVALVVGDETLICTVRVDLEDVSTLEGVHKAMAPFAARFSTAQFLLIAFSHRPDWAMSILGLLEATLGPSRVLDAAVTDGDQWWELNCPSPREHATGHVLMLSMRIQAEAVARGLAVASSREEIASWVAGPSPSTLNAEQQDDADARRWAAWMTDSQAVDHIAEAIGQIQHSGHIDTVTALRLTHLVSRTQVAEAAWVAADATIAHDLLRVWTAVVAHTPATIATAPLMLCGQAAWLTGNGVLQNCTLTRAARLNPRHRLYIALDQIQRTHLHPSQWNTIDHDPHGLTGPRQATA